MKRGIDISKWDEGIDIASLDIDFVIMKLSEGVNFKDKSFDGFKKQVEIANKPWGFYHFARENEPDEEAYWFYLYSSSFYNSAIPILDYETNNNDNVKWCEKFMNTYHALTNVWPMLYISASRCGEYTGSWLRETCKLWVAGYPYHFDEWPDIYPPYNIEPWKAASIWQFASDFYVTDNVKVDANVCYDNELFITNKNTNNYEALDDVVKKVINGEYGNGIHRREKLKEEGYDYQEVQNRVNDYFLTANKVIDGKYGNGAERKIKLKNAGYDYALVQKIVNDFLT